jgi:hypothetical protein
MMTGDWAELKKRLSLLKHLKYRAQEEEDALEGRNRR